MGLPIQTPLLSIKPCVFHVTVLKRGVERNGVFVFLELTQDQAGFELRSICLYLPRAGINEVWFGFSLLGLDLLALRILPCYTKHTLY